MTAPSDLHHRTDAADPRRQRRAGGGSNSERVVDALSARVSEVEYLRNETEGHWFINQESNIELYRTLERFLARHLGGRAEHDVQGA